MRDFKLRAGFLPLLLTAALLGCQTDRVAPPVTGDERVAPVVSAKRILAVYEGVLPCAGCRGIRTELTLFEEDFTYKLVETYLGTPDGDRTIASDGRWTLLRPTPKDPKAAVYQLHPVESGDVRSFLVVDERQLRQLDSGGTESEPRLGSTLTRKNPPVSSN